MHIVPMSLELINSMGDDISVVNAARVSFDKESELEYPDTEGPDFKGQLQEKDQKLLYYLAKHSHWSPFSHVFLSFRIKVPMFIAMQLDKHTVGLTTNSVSRRYVSSEPEVFFPKTWRSAVENVKQGSGEDLPLSVGRQADAIAKEATKVVLDAYDRLLGLGVCPEQAREILGMNTMRESIWSGSLAAFARVYKLRSDSHAQKEIQDIASKLNALVPEQMTHSWKALTE